MLQVRKSQERGRAEHGWLSSRHTFSFAEYYDPKQMGFGDLRVINEDRVQPGAGFPTHPHRDMEILSYVVSGALEHKDSMGTGSVIRPGEIQYMSAGSGVLHSEYNASQTEPVHFLQIWIKPNTTGKPAAYRQNQFAESDRQGRWHVLVDPAGRDGAIAIKQDARLLTTAFRPGEGLKTPLAADRRYWLQVVQGELDVNGVRVQSGDGVAIEQEPELALAASQASELLLFDLQR